jgi:hypothetical protein
MRLVGHVARMGGSNGYRSLVGNQKKRPLGRRRCRCEINIKMVVRGLVGTDWSDLSLNKEEWRALVHTVTILRDPQNTLSKCLGAEQLAAPRERLISTELIAYTKGNVNLNRSCSSR